MQNWSYSTVHVYRAGYFSPEADGDADAHANTDQARHCQEQPHLEIDLDIISDGSNTRNVR